MAWTEPARSPAALFAIDVRSLAALRIGLGAVLLIDLAVRATDLEAHYTDSGVLPRATLAAHITTGWRLSVHALSGALPFQAALFVLAVVFAAMLLVGLRARLALIASWLLLISLHGRNPLVLQGGDTMLRLLLFWAMFLPLGATWSLDARSTPAGGPAGRIASPATAALLCQVCLVYWFSAAFKSYRVWWLEGSALNYALNIDQFVTPYGRALLAHPAVLRTLSRLVWWTEWVGPALAFVPLWTPAVRLAVVLLFAALHLGFGLCLELGLFTVISVLGWVAFIPGALWDAIARRTSEDAAPVMYGSTGPGVLAFLLLAYVTWWNFDTLPHTAWHMPSQLRWVGEALRLDQRWKMFAPVPLRRDGWYVIPGRLTDGRTVNLFRPTLPLRWKKPALVSATYRNQRWRKYLMNLSRKRFAAYRPDYARYLCRAWNQERGRHVSLRTVHMYFMQEQTLGPNWIAPPHRVLLLRHTCEARPIRPPVP